MLARIACKLNGVKKPSPAIEKEHHRQQKEPGPDAADRLKPGMAWMNLIAVYAHELRYPNRMEFC